MIKKKLDIAAEIDHLYRYEYGKLVAVLTKTFGTNNMQLAEDVVQEAMLEALKQWTYKGVPDNSVGWIYQVAKYKAVNLVNREKHKRKYASEVVHHLQSEWTVEPALSHLFSDQEIADDQLRMIFTCCHPSISRDSQVALTLKTLCGFSIPEIAKAFVTTEGNINKRLVRARKMIRDADIPFEVPSGENLKNRLSSVLETLYLLFNEGYNASSGDHLIRFELCSEAIRLAEIISTNPHTNSSTDTYALLSLMSLNASRFRARMDKTDNMLDLEHQDRRLWDRSLIQKGLGYLSFATRNKEVSLYHILATISAHHCTAKTFGDTDWESILTLYDSLIQIDASPIIQLNRAVVRSKLTNPKQALKEIDLISEIPALQSYLPYYTVKAELHFQNSEPKKAVLLLEYALSLAENQKVKLHILNKLEEYSKG